MNVFSRVFGKAVYHFTSNWFLVNDTKTNIGSVIQYTVYQGKNSVYCTLFFLWYKHQIEILVIHSKGHLFCFNLEQLIFCFHNSMLWRDRV